MLQTVEENQLTYVFGETEYQVCKIINIPCNTRGYEFLMRTEVVRGDIPWLVGKETMERMDMRIDMRKKEIDIGVLQQKGVKCRENRKGHLMIQLRKGLNKNFVWYQENTKEDVRNSLNRKKALRKLHIQFGHPGIEKLWRLILDVFEKDTLKEDERRSIRQSLEDMQENCDVCIRFKRTPARPIVGLPLGRVCNEVVCMDLGELDGEKFLVMIDSATRYCQASWVKSKKPEEITKRIMEKWISLFGAPKELFSDSGLEFSNEEMKKMTERFGIKQKVTAARSPFSNGLCERMVGLLKDSIRKLREEGIHLEIGLMWSVAAKNSLSDANGFAPNHLVFDRNTGLPNLTTV